MEQVILKCPVCKQDVVADVYDEVTAVYCNYCRNRLSIDKHGKIK